LQCEKTKFRNASSHRHAIDLKFLLKVDYMRKYIHLYPFVFIFGTLQRVLLAITKMVFSASHVLQAIHVQIVFNNHNHVYLVLTPQASATAIALSVQEAIIVQRQEHRPV
jgi:hypothetical protein